ncbi:hypothetical protein [Arthrobacter sp. NEB 688]|uniref:hypothetical protein n=1 Tax=Arthrobacter sp. NEB 688 TaxID=904039 RepID=UPI001563D1D6|nr:hypothetical protein [Arthrobacter sp. NEB 688]QKE84618.1 hypothetical protein HL663_12160 [Arthrobacter sp. NEB 688]
MADPEVSKVKLALGLVLGLAGAVFVALLFGVGEQHTGINGVGGRPDSTRLDLAVESCNQSPRVEVVETESQVSVSAFIRRPGLLDGRGDCLDLVRVTLDSELGDRTVVDTASGRQLVPQAE